MAAGLGSAIDKYKTQTESLLGKLSAEVETLRRAGELSERSAEIGVMAEVAEKVSRLQAEHAQRLAELEKLNREGKDKEGESAIKQYFQIQEREIELLRKKMELVRDFNEEKLVTDHAKPGFSVEGFCGTESCELYSRQVFLNLGFGTFECGPNFSDYSCPMCDKVFQKVANMGFINPNTGESNLRLQVQYEVLSGHDKFQENQQLVQRVASEFIGMLIPEDQDVDLSSFIENFPFISGHMISSDILSLHTAKITLSEENLITRNSPEKKEWIEPAIITELDHVFRMVKSVDGSIALFQKQIDELRAISAQQKEASLASFVLTCEEAEKVRLEVLQRDKESMGLARYNELLWESKQITTSAMANFRTQLQEPTAIHGGIEKLEEKKSASIKIKNKLLRLE